MALCLAVPLAPPAFAQQPATATATLDRPDAFEHAFAVSLYEFDACGDALAGRMFRRALAERFASCPFSTAARARYQQRTRLQLRKTRDWLEEMIEARGGLPVRLDGMTTTCHAQQMSAEYRGFRERLEQYANGALPADAVLAAPCDAADIAP